MRGTRTAAAALAGAAAIMALVASGAGGAELTREEYTARLEPICKRNIEANRRIFQGARAKVNAGRLKQASTHFLRAASAFLRTVRQMEAVPVPSGDEAKLSRWFELLHDESRFVRRIGEALAAGQKRRAEAISVHLNRNSTRANNTALGFGFDYCRIEPTRFGST
jgi:hypothetical protein